jgi:hypothetical protein
MKVLYKSFDAKQDYIGAVLFFKFLGPLVGDDSMKAARYEKLGLALCNTGLYADPEQQSRYVSEDDREYSLEMGAGSVRRIGSGFFGTGFFRQRCASHLQQRRGADSLEALPELSPSGRDSIGDPARFLRRNATSRRVDQRCRRAARYATVASRS